MIALQEAIEHFQHECFTNHFYITQYAGCTLLFDKDTSHSDIQVKSTYLHDNRNGQDQAVKGGQSGWVLQAVISRGSFRRLPREDPFFNNDVAAHQQPILLRSAVSDTSCYLQSVL